MENHKNAFGRVFRGCLAMTGLKDVEFIEDFKNKTGIILLKSAVSNYKSGLRLPECPTLMAMADYFDVALDYLMGRSAAELKVAIMELLYYVKYRNKKSPCFHKGILKPHLDCFNHSRYFSQ